MTSSTDILVESALERVGLWLDSLEREFEVATKAHLERQEVAAVEYVAMLRDLLTKSRRGYDRYRAQKNASATERLKWLQQIGDTIAHLESLFARVSSRTSAEVAPLVAAFGRLFRKLVPDHSAVFRPVRDFNYELEEMPSEDFADLLLERTYQHKWPVLFITIPTGLLDSPRAHVLIAHEIGHAIAAVHREEEYQHELSIEEAVSSGRPVPPKADRLLPHPKASRREVLRIAKEKWTESGYPDFEKTGEVDQRVLVELVREVQVEIDDLLDAWLEELFGDAVGACVFGPAFLMAVLEVLLTTGSLESGSDSHPPLASRLLCIGRVLQHSELGDMIGAMPENMKARFESAMSEATAAVATPKTAFRNTEERLEAMVLQLLLADIDRVVSVALEWVKGHGQLYTANDLAKDLATHLTSLVQLGVPPLGKDIRLATVFNVGQVLCTDHMKKFCPADEREEKEPKIDALLLKAVELNELATAWAEA